MKIFDFSKRAQNLLRPSNVGSYLIGIERQCFWETVDWSKKILGMSGVKGQKFGKISNFLQVSDKFCRQGHRFSMTKQVPRSHLETNVSL